MNLDSAEKIDDINLNMAALGNTASSDIIKYSKKFKEHENKLVRGASVLAAKNFLSSENADFLVERLSNDNSEQVRYRAASGLRGFNRFPDTLSKQMRLYSSEKSARIRCQILKNLWNAREESMQAVEFVIDKSETEKNLECRKLAYFMIKPYLKILSR